MIINNVNCDIIEMTCRQLGATQIRKINGSLYQFEFDINPDFNLSYSFNVNHKNEYSLRRIQPYSFFKGKITTAREVIDLVKSDLARFRNAANSTNFKEFIETVNEIHAIGEDMDHLFLHFNVDKEALSSIREELKIIRGQINKAKDDAEKIQIKTISEG